MDADASMPLERRAPASAGVAPPCRGRHPAARPGRNAAARMVGSGAGQCGRRRAWRGCGARHAFALAFSRVRPYVCAAQAIRPDVVPG
jgi:hypothetical protein